MIDANQIKEKVLKYFTLEEFDTFSKEEIDLQAVLGLESCKTKQDVIDIFHDIRLHEHIQTAKEIFEKIEKLRLCGYHQVETCDEECYNEFKKGNTCKHGPCMNFEQLKKELLGVEER